MAQEPNVIDLYEGAVHQMLPILGGIKADQLGVPPAPSGRSRI